MIKCDICGNNITRSDDVNVLALFGVKPTTFCNDCYAKKERGIVRNVFYFPAKYPLNSTLFTLGLVLFSIIGAIFLVAMLLNYAILPAGWVGGLAFTIVIILVMLFEWTLWFTARRRVRQAQS